MPWKGKLSSVLIPRRVALPSSIQLSACCCCRSLIKLRVAASYAVFRKHATVMRCIALWINLLISYSVNEATLSLRQGETDMLSKLQFQFHFYQRMTVFDMTSLSNTLINLIIFLIIYIYLKDLWKKNHTFFRNLGIKEWILKDCRKEY